MKPLVVDLVAEPLILFVSELLLLFRCWDRLLALFITADFKIPLASAAKQLLHTRDPPFSSKSATMSLSVEHDPHTKAPHALY